MLGARGIYFGGYPWRDLGIVTAADLNAAVATAMQEPSTLNTASVLAAIADGSLSNSKLMYPYITIGSTTIPLGPSNIVQLTGISPPQNPSDVATKYYVDNVVGLEGYTAGVGLNLIGNQFNIAQTGVAAGVYGSATLIPALTINTQGQITHAGQVAISMSAGNLSNGTVGSGAVVLSQSPTLAGVVTFQNTLQVNGGGTAINAPNGNVGGLYLTGTNDVIAQNGSFKLNSTGAFLSGFPPFGWCLIDATGTSRTLFMYQDPVWRWQYNGPNFGDIMSLNSIGQLILNGGGWALSAPNGGLSCGVQGGVGTVQFGSATLAASPGQAQIQATGGGNLGTFNIYANQTNCSTLSAGANIYAQSGSTVVSNVGIAYASFGFPNQVGFAWNGNLNAMIDNNNVGIIQFTSSDRRLKENVEVSDHDALAAIRATQLYSFDRLPPPVPGDEHLPKRHHDVGFVAQEMAHISSAVIEPPDDREDWPSCLDLLPITAYAWRAIQQLAERLEALEARA